ncbi:MAG: hypothetical protein IJE78_00455 [Bacteroidaceae bacterium]|nr:hypothetical protein [Bacteroidaceae bacterium]MBQ2855584.1 hypothetical protein [Bacteroidaceae bacterium]
MSYNSKYKGSEVEELLDSIGNKVDKVDGKQLSTEDFTTLLKQKLDGLSNYDDTEISQAIEQLRSDFDTLVSGDTTTAQLAFAILYKQFKINQSSKPRWNIYQTHPKAYLV